MIMWLSYYLCDNLFGTVAKFAIKDGTWLNVMQINLIQQWWKFCLGESFIYYIAEPGGKPPDVVNNCMLADK